MPIQVLGNCSEEHQDETQGHETKIPDLNSEQCKSFQVFFLMNDDDQNVVVVETNEIDLEEVIGCLKQGDSVFIKCKSTVPVLARANIKKKTSRK